jgi:hypothetical protein
VTADEARQFAKTKSKLDGSAYSILLECWDRAIKHASGGRRNSVRASELDLPRLILPAGTHLAVVGELRRRGFTVREVDSWPEPTIEVAW